MALCPDYINQLVHDLNEDKEVLAISVNSDSSLLAVVEISRIRFFNLEKLDKIKIAKAQERNEKLFNQFSLVEREEQEKKGGEDERSDNSHDDDEDDDEEEEEKQNKKQKAQKEKDDEDDELPPLSLDGDLFLGFNFSPSEPSVFVVASRDGSTSTPTSINFSIYDLCQLRHFKPPPPVSAQELQPQKPKEEKKEKEHSSSTSSTTTPPQFTPAQEQAMLLFSEDHSIPSYVSQPLFSTQIALLPHRTKKEQKRFQKVQEEKGEGGGSSSTAAEEEATTMNSEKNKNNKKKKKSKKTIRKFRLLWLIHGDLYLYKVESGQKTVFGLDSEWASLFSLRSFDTSNIINSSNKNNENHKKAPNFLLGCCDSTYNRASGGYFYTKQKSAIPTSNFSFAQKRLMSEEEDETLSPALQQELREQDARPMLTRSATSGIGKISCATYNSDATLVAATFGSNGEIFLFSAISATTLKRFSFETLLLHHPPSGERRSIENFGEDCQVQWAKFDSERTLIVYGGNYRSQIHYVSVERIRRNDDNENNNSSSQPSSFSGTSRTPPRRISPSSKKKKSHQNHHHDSNNNEESSSSSSSSPSSVCPSTLYSYKLSLCTVKVKNDKRNNRSSKKVASSVFYHNLRAEKCLELIQTKQRTIISVRPVVGDILLRREKNKFENLSEEKKHNKNNKKQQQQKRGGGKSMISLSPHQQQQEEEEEEEKGEQEEEENDDYESENDDDDSSFSLVQYIEDPLSDLKWQRSKIVWRIEGFANLKWKYCFQLYGVRARVALYLK